MGILFMNVNDKFYFNVVDFVLDKKIYVTHITTANKELFREEKFYNIEIIDSNSFEYASKIKKLNYENNYSLSSKELDEYLECERFFLSNSDRFCYLSISVQERIKMFQELLLYWLNFFEKNSIECIFWDSTPHMNWDNIIYYIAKKKNIKTIYLERTLLEDRVILLEDYKKIYKVPLGYLKSSSKEKLINLLGTDLYEISFLESKWLVRSKEINKNVISPSRIKILLRNIKRLSRIKNIFRYMRNKLKLNLCFSSTFYNDITNKFYINLLYYHNNIRTKKLRKFYKELTKEIDLEKKYIFFALQYQAERSTSPMGGYFENQILAIDILSKSVPKDWLIYAKEHPRQFITKELRTRHHRSEDFYRRLISYPNVKLININEPTNKLIDKSICVSTITGSVGWEGLLKNKAAIVFGNPWYSPCNSCYVISSREDCFSVINKIEAKSSKEIEIDVLKFLVYYKNKLITSSNSYEMSIKSKVKYEKLIENLGNAIIETINKK